MSSQISPYKPTPGSLVLYKIRPAIVTAVSDKIDILLDGGKSKRVRPKDITLLHPGPISELSELKELEANIDETWELLLGAETNLEELSDLLYGDYTPAAAWSAWLLVADGLYFAGTPESITTRSSEQVEADLEERESKLAAERAWSGLLERIKQGRIEDDDRERLIEVEKLALKQSENSRILKALGYQEKMEHAHRLLCKIGYWEEDLNPYPLRQSLPIVDPDLIVPELEQEQRLDLTNLPAFAIDDQDSEDPDDAISLDGDMLWVHVADAAALVRPDSELDLEARSRAANLYLPEGTVHMLSHSITHKLGLGLQDESPALSVGFRLGTDAQITDTAIALTTIKATRHSYSEIDEVLSDEPFAALVDITQRYRKRRQESGARGLDLPEVSVKLVAGEVVIRPLERIGSRDMVTDAMLMAGEAVARYCLEHDIPIPFATQEPPELEMEPEGLAAMYSCRRMFKPSRNKTLEEPHSGLGLDVYSRVTSPLRRYLDLVVHQQLRAHLLGAELLSSQQISQRIAESDLGSARVRKAERLSNSHWKMIYLKQNPKWQGEGVVVEMQNGRATLLIPELALETKIRVGRELDLDSKFRLELVELDVPDLLARFRIVN
jgi:exoribonuclease-2